MTTMMMSPAHGIRKRRTRRPRCYRASAQLTATEQLFKEAERPEDDFEHTVTEADTDFVPPWLSDALGQLQAIAALPDGWDSYGAARPNPAKLEAGWCLLVCLCQNTDLPKPFVNPTRSGGVQFEWEAGDRYFEIELVSEQKATYLYCDDAAREEEGGILTPDDRLEPIREYVCKVTNA